MCSLDGLYGASCGKTEVVGYVADPAYPPNLASYDPALLSAARSCFAAVPVPDLLFLEEAKAIVIDCGGFLLSPADFEQRISVEGEVRPYMCPTPRIEQCILVLYNNL